MPILEPPPHRKLGLLFIASFRRRKERGKKAIIRVRFKQRPLARLGPEVVATVKAWARGGGHIFTLVGRDVCIAEEYLLSMERHARRGCEARKLARARRTALRS